MREVNSWSSCEVLCWWKKNKQVKNGRAILILILIWISLPHIDFHKGKKVNVPDLLKALSDFGLCVGLLWTVYEQWLYNLLGLFCLSLISARQLFYWGTCGLREFCTRIWKHLKPFGLHKGLSPPELRNVKIPYTHLILSIQFCGH